MPSVAFPEPVAFGAPETEGAALKVLVEAAELVEAVKELRLCDRPLADMGLGDLSEWELARRVVLDEAMDVYQALANYGPACEMPQSWNGEPAGATKDSALDVLCRAALLYAGKGTHLRLTARTFDALARLLCGEFTDAEIAEAYERCVERNRERGRYE